MVVFPWIFVKTLISPTYFNDFIKLLGDLWIILGQIFAYERDFGVTLASLWGYFGSLWGHLGAPGAAARGQTQFHSRILI